MNLSGLTLEDIQILAAAANQAQQLSRQATPPVTPSSVTPKPSALPSASSTRAPSPTLNGSAQFLPLTTVSPLKWFSCLFVLRFPFAEFEPKLNWMKVPSEPLT